MATLAKHCIARFTDIESVKSSKSVSSPNPTARHSIHFNNHKYYKELSSLSMNGCQGDNPRAPIGTIETKTFPVAPTPASAADRLNSAIYDLKSNPSQLDSGIIRLEVPIEEHIEALDWLRSQSIDPGLPRSYYSGRESSVVPGLHNNDEEKLVSVAGFGSAVSFRHLDAFSLNDWHSIKRFLSKSSPLIRAYGGMRFDARANISPEWQDFASFYFMVPQIEFDEFEGRSMIAATVAWDNRLSTTYEQAVAALEATMWQLSSAIKFNNNSSEQPILLDQTHVPNQISWELAVNKALDSIKSKDSALNKVVLARSSRVHTNAEIDPLMWLEALQAAGVNSYQFCLQPPEAPAFIGNTPERLFYRDQLSVTSDALAATRARGTSEALDIEIGRDLLSSPKDHHEFAVVRESIRRKLEAICSSTIVEPNKALRKLPRIQHLYAKLTGTLEREDDEFKILSSLHPTPAVCGQPMEDARVFIIETESFDRGYYAGPVGWFGGAESEFAVGIRSALVGKDIGAILYAGTGIVEGSKPAMEWKELELKTSQFTKLMKREAPRMAISGQH
ncbi:LOW QUALITY PROTEIN: isochorismate synthase, chloroplastic-like [Primulina eburnea]|uniref:LOW QUALITY PROTEIN: isochorismate synthase, chloroplastic-like n=1 Tax=Primulina eburnea TaxID=1245227 RepID=UPI003C6CA607